jgi:hypothetical protein
MRSLSARLAALEERLAMEACTCPPLIVLEQRFGDQLSHEELRARARAKSGCVVHPGEPATLVVIINRFSDGVVHEVV